MHLVPGIFAASVLDSVRAWSASKSGTFQTLVFFGVFAVLTLVVFGWAVLFRQQPHRRQHHGSRSKPAGTAAPADGFLSHRRHKHRRKAHRPVNPTLAQTGGLPAPRDGKPPPAPPA